MVMAVKDSYSILGWEKSHSFVIDDVDKSHLGHFICLKKEACRVKKVAFTIQKMHGEFTQNVSFA